MKGVVEGRGLTVGLGFLEVVDGTVDFGTVLGLLGERDSFAVGFGDVVLFGSFVVLSTDKLVKESPTVVFTIPLGGVIVGVAVGLIVLGRAKVVDIPSW